MYPERKMSEILSKFVLKKFLALFVAFILLTVSVLGVHGSALPSNEFSTSFCDKTENVESDIKSLEEIDERNEIGDRNRPVKVTADIQDGSGVKSVTFTKDSTKVDGLLVSGNMFNAGFWLGLSLGSLIKTVMDVSVGFTVKVKAYDYVGNWNESSGTYKGPFTVMAEIAVSMLTAAWNAMCKVAEKIVDALESLVSWIWDVVEGMINAVVQPIVDAMENYVIGIGKALEKAYDDYSRTGSVSSNTISEINQAIFLSPFFIVLSVVGVIVYAILTLITPFTVAVAALLTTVIAFVGATILSSLILSNVEGTDLSIYDGISLSETSILDTIKNILGLNAAAREVDVNETLSNAEISSNIIKVILGAAGIVAAGFTASLVGVADMILSIAALVICMYADMISTVIGQLNTALVGLALCLEAFLGSIPAMCRPTTGEMACGCISFLISPFVWTFAIMNLAKAL